MRILGLPFWLNTPETKDSQRRVYWDEKKKIPQQLVRCIFRWRFTVDICLARGEPLYKKSMSVPMNKWWADEGCASSCPICTLMKPLKWLELSGKSELWVWSRLQQRLLFGLFWIMMDFIPGLSQEAAAVFALNFWWNSALLNRLCFYFWGDPRGRWVNPTSAGVILSSEYHRAPTKDQCDGLLKWTEF